MKQKLKDIAVVTMGQSPKGDTYNSEGNGMPFLQGNRTFGDRYPTFDTWTTSPTKIAESGDVIMSVRAPVGALNITPVKMCLGRGVCSIRAKNGCQDYIYYLMKYSMKKLLSKESGTVFGSVNRDDIECLDVDVPKTIEEQEKIARFLSIIDKKIETNKQINDNLYQLLGRSFRNDYFDAAIGHPEWALVTLDDITSKFATGLNPRKNFVLGHGTNYYVTIKNMGNNRIYLDDRCDMIDDDALVKINARSDLRIGDLLFSGIGTIGRVYLIDRPATNWNTSESIFTMRPSKSVSSEFLFLLLLNYDMQDYAISLASGSVQKGIRMADLKRYQLYLPTAEKMKQFTEMWKPMIKKIKANEYESDNLARLRDTLLPKLMSGEIDISNIEI